MEPVLNESEILIRKLWIAVYAACIADSKADFYAANKANDAIKEYEKVFDK